MTAPPIPPARPLFELRAVLWHFGNPGGRKPGSFGVALLSAAAKADRTNRARLEQAFPEYLIPFTLMASKSGGTAAVEHALVMEADGVYVTAAELRAMADVLQ